VNLGDLTWTELRDRGALTLVLPLGATEQHGPHLPIDTDTTIAVALAHALAARRAGVVVAPALPYGSSGEHAAFPGTLSLGQAALELAVVELARSADRFARIVVLCWHGGNVEPLARAAALLTAEGRSVDVWQPRHGGGDLHAGRTETSLMLWLAPDRVRAERPVGCVRPWREIEPELRGGGVGAVADNGVLGDPRDASAEEGERLFAALVDDLERFVARVDER